jgi:hypothetical protein
MTNTSDNKSWYIDSNVYYHLTFQKYIFKTIRASPNDPSIRKTILSKGLLKKEVLFYP